MFSNVGVKYFNNDNTHKRPDQGQQTSDIKKLLFYSMFTSTTRVCFVFNSPGDNKYIEPK